MSFTGRTVVVSLLFVGIVLLLLTGCSRSPGMDQKSSSSPTSQSAVSTSTPASDHRLESLFVPLKHSASGSASMQWNPITHILMVQMTFHGLIPGTTYSTHILTGNCKEQGKNLYTLESLITDVKGVASSTTQIAGVASGIPLRGWHITVWHNVPAKSDQKTMVGEGTPVGAGQSAQSSVLACMDVINKNLPNRKLAQNVIARWSGEQPSGHARLSIESGKLAVRVTMSGLTPNATFTGLVMPGSCTSKGKALYTLKSLVTDASGNGTALTIIPAVSQLPDGGWSIRYTLAPEAVAQADPAQVSCGDVFTAEAPPSAST